MGNSANFVGTVPTYYDDGLGPVLFQHYAQKMAARAASANPSSVLELAAGTGIVTTALRTALEQTCFLTATDLNKPMLDVAEAKISGNAHTNFMVTDAQDLTFDDNSFDLIVCQFGVMFFPDRLLSYKEARRVLKPGGRYLFSVWNSWRENPFAQLTHETIAAFFEGDPPGFYKVPFGYHDTDAIKAALLEAGFETVDHQRLPHQSPVTDMPGFAKALVYGNPTREEIIAREGDPDAVVIALEKSLREAFGSQEHMPLEAIIFSAC